MFGILFAVIGALIGALYLWPLSENLIFKRRYRGLQEALKDTYCKVSNSDKEVFTKGEVQDILGLLHNRQCPKQGYFKKENK